MPREIIAQSLLDSHHFTAGPALPVHAQTGGCR
jgi:hypothetical protein